MLGLRVPSILSTPLPMAIGPQSPPGIAAQYWVSGQTGVTQVDTAAILTSVSNSGAFTVPVLDADLTASEAPGAGVMWHTAPLDIYGISTDDADDIDLDDNIRIILWAQDDAPETDVVLWSGLTIGVPGAATPGFAVGLDYNAGGWRVKHAVNTGAGWTIVNAGAVSANTRGAVLQVALNTTSTQARVSGFGIDTNGAVITTASVATAASTSAVTNGFDKFFYGVGWVAGAIGTPGATPGLSARLQVYRRGDMPNIARTL